MNNDGAKFKGTYQGCSFTHVSPNYCTTCAGSGKSGHYRWTLNKKGEQVPAKPERCPTCKGTGRPRGYRKPTAMRNLLILIFIAVIAILALAAVGFVKASEFDCTAIRDYDKRQECLAISRGSKEGCTSIRNYDQRQICRNRAEHMKELRR